MGLLSWVGSDPSIWLTPVLRIDSPPQWWGVQLLVEKRKSKKPTCDFSGLTMGNYKSSPWVPHREGCPSCPPGLGTQFSSVQFSLSRVQLFVTSWTAAHQASLSITNSRSLSIESVMPSNHLILCGSLLLPPTIFPRIRVFSKESVLCIRWPKYWSFSFSISSSNEYSGLIFFRMD